MKSKRDAFTLLELLIALSFFSIVMVVVGSVFATGISAWRRGEGESGIYQEARVALERMAVELRNVVSYEGIPFEGKKDLLSFIRVRSSRASQPEWAQVTYTVQRTADSAFLVRRESPFLGGEEKEAAFFLSFSEIRFAYPSFEEGSAWVWKESWEGASAQSPPPFLKMELSLGQEVWEKRFWIPTGTWPEETPTPPE